MSFFDAVSLRQSPRKVPIVPLELVILPDSCVAFVKSLFRVLFLQQCN